MARRRGPMSRCGCRWWSGCCRRVTATCHRGRGWCSAMSERRRRRAYDRRVETAVQQLLGFGYGDDACPDPDDPLHVGVAARLALLVAGDGDGRLLLSRARDIERVERRLRLQHEAVRTVRQW